MSYSQSYQDNSDSQEIMKNILQLCNFRFRKF